MIFVICYLFAEQIVEKNRWKIAARCGWKCGADLAEIYENLNGGVESISKMCIDKAHEHPGNLYNGNRVFMASKSFYEGAKGIGELVEDCGVDEAVEKALGKLKGLVAEEGASLWTKFAERVGLDSLWGALSDVGAALGSDLLGGSVGDLLLLLLL